MCVFSTKNKTYRYNFNYKGRRYTESGFKTIRDAKKAEAKRRAELENPPPIVVTPIDMVCLELVNRRLDHIKAYNSDVHYKDTLYLAKYWIITWGKLLCSEITQPMIEKFILGKLKKVLAVTVNKEIIHLKALFNWGIKKKLITVNPVVGIDFLPTEKRLKYVPPAEDVDKVIELAPQDTQDYLWAIRETLARVNEINQLTWDDVDLDNRSVVLYTRKKKGGHLTPRKIPMTNKLHGILSRRYAARDAAIRAVFWNKDRGEAFSNRNKLMQRLCLKAEVRPFGYHALRHMGASIMDMNNVPIGAIQRLLGHENRTTTEIYLHTIGNAERLAIDVYERAREGFAQQL